MNIAVLFGGRSPERQVSLVSGTMVANAFLRLGHRVLLLDIADDVDHPCYREGGDLFSSSSARRPSGGKELGKGVLEALESADRVFLALHGGIGEDGRLQGLLECLGIPYTGTGSVGSMLAMDKILSKQLFDSVGLPTPRWMSVDLSMPDEDVLRAIGGRIGYPCVLKSANAGSSIGVYMADEEASLRTALREARTTGGGYLAERRIVGRELTASLLNGTFLPLTEIIPADGVYDYENKYNGKTQEICPAAVDDGTEARARAFSFCAAHILRLRGYARFDFMLDHTGGLWLLEANTLPGMTPTSLFPLAAKAAGIQYDTMCQRLLMADFVY